MNPLQIRDKANEVIDDLKYKILQLINFHHKQYKNVVIELKDTHINVKYQTVESKDGIETLKDHSGFIAFNDELGEGELRFYEKWN